MVISSTNSSIAQKCLSPGFDHVDTFYLANNFSIEQLRSEVNNAKRWFPFEDWHADFISCCEDATKWIRASQMRLTPKSTSNFVDISSLKQSIDIVDVAGAFTKLGKCGRNFKGCCPFHSEKTPSFMVYPDQQTWHCFGACNTGGDVISLVMKARHIDFKNAVDFLKGT